MIAITSPTSPYRYGDPDVDSLEFAASGATGTVHWSTNHGTLSNATGASTVLTPGNQTRTITITAEDDSDTVTALFEVEGTLPAVADWGVESDINPGFEVSIAESGPPKFRIIPQTAQWPLTFRTRKFTDYATVRDFLLAHQTLPFWIEDYQLGELRKVYLDSAFRRVGRRTNWLEFSFQVRDYDYHGPANVADIGPFAPPPPPEPPQLGLVLWHEARFVTGLANNDPVDLSPDQSPSGNDATSEGSARPLWVENVLNGQPAFLFDGIDDFFSFDSITLPEMSVFVVCWQTENADVGVLANDGGASQFRFGMIAGAREDQYTVYDGTNTLLSDHGINSWTTPTCRGFTRNADTINFYENGVLVGTAAIGSPEEMEFTKCGTIAGANFFNGYAVGPPLIYNRVLEADEIL